MISALRKLRQEDYPCPDALLGTPGLVYQWYAHSLSFRGFRDEEGALGSQSTQPTNVKMVTTWPFNRKIYIYIFQALMETGCIKG
jgi:hypothetical protein